MALQSKRIGYLEQAQLFGLTSNNKRGFVLSREVSMEPFKIQSTLVSGRYGTAIDYRMGHHPHHKFIEQYLVRWDWQKEDDCRTFWVEAPYIGPVTPKEDTTP